MDHGAITSLEQLPPARAATFRPWTRVAFALMTLAGFVAFFVVRNDDPIRAWYNYLIGFFFILCLAAFGGFFTALQHITGSIWSVGVRRVAESFVFALPLVILLFLGLIQGLPYLYQWADPHVVAHDLLIRKKAAFLNPSFFTMLGMTVLLLWTVLGGLMVRNSLAQDVSRNPELTVRNTRLAAIFILVFAVSFALLSFSLIMSIEAAWFSTMFGVYCFAGLFLTGIATITLVVCPQYLRGAYGAVISAEQHLYDLGKLMLAFTVFWAYIAFSQYMLIWYADLPEETFFYLERFVPGWRSVSWALLILHFVVPFLLLLPQAVKKCPYLLQGFAVWMLAMEYLDLYWLIVPPFAHDGPLFGWQEVAIFAGFIGAFGLVVSSVLTKVPLIARGDPRLLESVNFHQ